MIKKIREPGDKYWSRGVFEEQKIALLAMSKTLICACSGKMTLVGILESCPTKYIYRCVDCREFVKILKKELGDE